MTGNKVELGDFSFFAQGLEAIRISLLEYHQFPWWNPWVSGGVPLYANPQFGLFSIQTALTLIIGPVMALKLTIVLFTVLGYITMYLLLTRYFKVASLQSTLLSLIWIFCSFFACCALRFFKNWARKIGFFKSSALYILKQEKRRTNNNTR